MSAGKIERFANSMVFDKLEGYDHPVHRLTPGKHDVKGGVCNTYVVRKDKVEGHSRRNPSGTSVAEGRETKGARGFSKKEIDFWQVRTRAWTTCNCLRC